MALKRSRNSASPSPTINGSISTDFLDPALTDSISTLKQNQQSISLQQSIVSQPEPIYEDANDDDELDLVLTEEDAHRLGVAITSIDTEDVLSYSVGDTIITIGEAFQTAGTPLNILRDATIDAVASLPSPSSPAAVNFLRTVLALLDDLEQRYRGEIEEDLETQPPPKKYMLHRGLATVDLFTAAAELTDDELALMDQAQDTDVIAVFPPSTSYPSTIEVPTLKAVNSRVKPSKKQGVVSAPVKPAPARLLYYDPFSSFAPTYDSTGANLTYTQTNTWRASKVKMAEWDLEPKEPIIRSNSSSTITAHEGASSVASTSANILTAPTASSTPLVLNPTESSTLLSLGIDPIGIAEGWEGYVEGQDSIDRELSMNSERVALLVRGQWDRLRKGKGVGEVEGNTATELLHSLASLIASLPKENGQIHRVVPPPERIEQVLPLIMNSLVKEASYHGSLESANFRAVKESDLRERKNGMAKMEE